MLILTTKKLIKKNFYFIQKSLPNVKLINKYPYHNYGFWVLDKERNLSCFLVFVKGKKTGTNGESSYIVKNSNVISFFCDKDFRSEVKDFLNEKHCSLLNIVKENVYFKDKIVPYFRTDIKVDRYLYIISNQERGIYLPYVYNKTWMCFIIPYDQDTEYLHDLYIKLYRDYKIEFIILN